MMAMLENQSPKQLRHSDGSEEVKGDNVFMWTDKQTEKEPMNERLITFDDAYIFLIFVKDQ